MKISALIAVALAVGSPIHEAKAASQPLIISTADGSCEAVLRRDDFFELDSLERLKFDWSGECKNGYVHGAGRFMLFSGDFIVAIQDFGPKKGVEFDSGVIHLSEFNFTQDSERRALSVGPGLLACPVNNIQREGIEFLDGVNVDSKRFLLEFVEWLEGRVNEVCRLTPGQKAKFDIFLRSANGRVSDLCNLHGHCSWNDFYIIVARIDADVSSSGYIDLKLESARAANGEPITSRYKDEMYKLNLSARRKQSERETNEKNNSVHSLQLSRKDEIKAKRAAERRALIDAARQLQRPPQSTERKQDSETGLSNDDAKQVDCLPLPTEYEIVHEVSVGDYRSSGEFQTLEKCEVERARSFSSQNAECMIFANAREKISPNTKDWTVAFGSLGYCIDGLR